jgi:hypothetical protein
MDLSMGLSPVFGRRARTPDRKIDDAELDELLLGDLLHVDTAPQETAHVVADTAEDTAMDTAHVADTAMETAHVDTAVDTAHVDTAHVDTAADTAHVETAVDTVQGASSRVVAFADVAPVVMNSSTAALNIVVTHIYVSDRRQQFSVTIKTDKTAAVRFVRGDDDDGSTSIASADVLRPVREHGTTAFTNARTGNIVKYCNISVGSRPIAYLARDLVVNWILKSAHGLKNRDIIEHPAMAACVAALEKCVTLGDVRAFFKDWTPALGVFDVVGADVPDAPDAPPTKRPKKALDQVLAFYNDAGHPTNELMRFINGPARAPEFTDFMLAAMRLPLRAGNVCASIDTMLCYA